MFYIFNTRVAAKEFNIRIYRSRKKNLMITQPKDHGALPTKKLKFNLI